MLPLVLIIGFAFRFFTLINRKSLWGDEWFSLGLATAGSWQETFWGAVHDVHPPVYFLLLRAAISSFGSDEWTLRLVSMVAGTGIIAGVYFLAKDIFGKKEAALAAFWVAVSPYWLQSSNEIRSYSLLGFVSTLGLYFFIRSLANGSCRSAAPFVLARPSARSGRTGRPASRHPFATPDKSATRESRVFSRGATRTSENPAIDASPKTYESVAYAVCAVLAVYIEHYAWFWVLACIAVSLIWMRRNQRLLMTQGLVLLASLPSLVLIAYQAVFRENMFHAYRVQEYLSLGILFKKFVGVFWHFACGYVFSMLSLDRVAHYAKTSPFFWLSAGVTALALAVVTAAFLSLWRSRKPVAALFFLVLVLPVVLLGFLYPIRLEARYLSFAAPVFFVLLAGGVSALPRAAAWGFALVFSAVSLIGAFYQMWLKTDPLHREDAMGVIAYAFGRATGEDAVCGLGPQVRYYHRILGLASDAAYFADWDDLVKADPRRFKNIWLIDGSNMQPTIARDMFERISTRMAVCGFEPVSAPVKTGGEEDLMVVYAFQKASAT